MFIRRGIGCLLFLTALSSETLAAQSGFLEQAGLPMISIAQLEQGPVMEALQELESRTTLRVRTPGDAAPRLVVSSDVAIVELTDLERPWETTLFFSRHDGRQVLFMRLSSLQGKPEIRMWSQGPTEIVLSDGKARKQLIPSGDTFRFDSLPGRDGAELSPADALDCLANILGLSSTNWTSVISFLTNLSCSNAGSVVFDTTQTLLHCFSMVSVGVANVTSTAGCVLGASKLIGCGYLTCSAPSVPAGMTASDGTYSDRIRVTWNTSQGASHYTLYRSQSSGSIGSAILSNSAATSFDDTSAVAGYKYYYYRVKACSRLGCSDISGADSGWRSASTGGGGCSGTTYSGSLAAGGSAVQPNGTYYESRSSGVHTGNLVGPSGADFDLYLYKWNGSSWTNVASKRTSSSVETLSYSGTAGYYYWRVHAYRGSGNYSLCISRP